MTTTLAARFYEPRKPLRLEEVSLRNVGDDDLLVEIKAAGVCHSDLHVIDGLFRPKYAPITLGHETSGLVIEKGKNVKGVEIGDRVGPEYLLKCGTCDFCLSGRDNLCENLKILSYNADGSWAGKIILPSRDVYKLPNNIGFAEGAIIICAVATSYHAMKLAGVSTGDTVMIYGLGGVGMSAVQWARIFGASEIIAVDIENNKLNLAKSIGATTIINASDTDPVSEIRKSGGVDFGFEVIGLIDTVKKTIACVKKGGKAMLVGMCMDKVPISPVYDMTGEISLQRPLDHVRSEIPQIYKLVEQGRFSLSGLVSHKLPLKEANEAVRILKERIGTPVRIVLEP